MHFARLQLSTAESHRGSENVGLSLSNYRQRQLRGCIIDRFTLNPCRRLRLSRAFIMSDVCDREGLGVTFEWTAGRPASVGCSNVVIDAGRVVLQSAHLSALDF